jgi:hypothetical protein
MAMLSAGRKNFCLEMKWGGENAKEKQKKSRQKNSSRAGQKNLKLNSASSRRSTLDTHTELLQTFIKD